MVKNDYFPERGDLVWLDFNPQSGHEQKGRRPAIVISPSKYNLKVGLALFCLVTSQIKDYPFEVKLPDNLIVNGVIIADQIKSFDWKSRNAEFIAKLPNDILDEILNKIKVLIV